MIRTKNMQACIGSMALIFLLCSSFSLRANSSDSRQNLNHVYTLDHPIFMEMYGQTFGYGKAQVLLRVVFENQPGDMPTSMSAHMNEIDGLAHQEVELKLDTSYLITAESSSSGSPDTSKMRVAEYILPLSLANDFRLYSITFLYHLTHASLANVEPDNVVLSLSLDLGNIYSYYTNSVPSLGVPFNALRCNSSSSVASLPVEDAEKDSVSVEFIAPWNASQDSTYLSISYGTPSTKRNPSGNIMSLPMDYKPIEFLDSFNAENPMGKGISILDNKEKTLHFNHPNSGRYLSIIRLNEFDRKTNQLKSNHTAILITTVN